MLELEGHIRPVRPGPFTNHNFFRWKGQKKSTHITTSWAPVRLMQLKPGASSRTRPHMDDNNNANSDNSDNDHKANCNSDVGALLAPPTMRFY